MRKVIFVVMILCVLVGSKSFGALIIVDHNNAALGQIPATAINTAKANLHIAYGHTSHGSQLITGMTGLVGKTGLVGYQGDIYQWNDGGSGGALDIDDTFMGGDLGHNGSTAWATSTRTYLDDSANSDVNVIIWSWCGGVNDNNEAGIQTYLDTMNQLESDYPDVTFVYMTGHAEGTGETGNLHVRNQQIRDYCIANNKVLYDFYDIELYNPDGDYFGDKSVEDTCGYDSDNNGSLDSNWATEWQNTHTENVDWYSCSSAHSQPLNANRKAYAAWWLWARIAGWYGGSGADTTAPTTPQDLTVTVASSSQLDLDWDAATDNIGVSGYKIYRDSVEIATTAQTEYSDTGLNTNNVYSYRVTAYDAAGNDGGYSNIASNQWIPELLIPSNGASNQQLALAFDWEDSPADISATYVLYYGTDADLTAIYPSASGWILPLNETVVAVVIVAFGLLLLRRFAKLTIAPLRLRYLLVALLTPALLVACGGGGSSSGGTSSSTALAVSTGSNSYYDVSDLESSTTYYWQVVATDNDSGATYSSATYNFTTEP